MSSQDRQQIIRLASAGMSRRAIARELGRSRDTIHRILADNQTPDSARRVVALR